MADDINIRELYNSILEERAKANGVVLHENVTIPAANSSPDKLVFDGVEYEYNMNTRPFSFIGEDSSMIGSINDEEGTHPFIFNAFITLAAALGVIPFPATSAYLASMYKGTTVEDVEDVLAENDVIILGKYDGKNLEEFATKQKSGTLSNTRVATRSGRVWYDIKSKKIGESVSVIAFWCRERDVSENELKALKLHMKTGKDLYWVATDSKKFKYYGDTFRDTSSGDVKELRSRIYPNLSHDDIVDILMRAHSGFKITPTEKRIVWEFRGFEPSEVRQVTGGYPSVAEYEYRRKLSESDEK